jgi:ArsR family transcriptional regulator
MTEFFDDQEHVEQVAELARALGHPLRARIVSLLATNDELHVSAMAERLGTPHAVISQQLRILRMSHLVSSTRRGGFAWYAITQPRLAELLRCLETCTNRDA